MYSPVRPVVMAVNDGDKRPQFAGYMISARSDLVRVSDRECVALCVEEYKDGSMLYWLPKKAIKTKKTVKKTPTKKPVKKAKGK